MITVEQIIDYISEHVSDPVPIICYWKRQMMGIIPIDNTTGNMILDDANIPKISVISIRF